MRFDFWQRWLLLGSLFFTAFGVVAAVASDSGLFAFWTARIDRVFFNGAISGEARAMRSFLMGPSAGRLPGAI
ncbi:MAG TPA: hypothetical protein ENI85_06505 [Deltaproteobacteria bacterium]|nr:hypothetical protein [Deltaproteobacteria bacterium]